MGVFVFTSLTDTLFPKKEMATDHPYDGCITVTMKYKFCSDGWVIEIHRSPKRLVICWSIVSFSPSIPKFTESSWSRDSMVKSYEDKRPLFFGNYHDNVHNVQSIIFNLKLLKLFSEECLSFLPLKCPIKCQIWWNDTALFVGKLVTIRFWGENNSKGERLKETNFLPILKPPTTKIYRDYIIYHSLLMA